MNRIEPESYYYTKNIMKQIEYNKLYNSLRLFYWINISILIVILAYLMYVNGPYWGEDIKTNAVYERYSIIITMACIPLALKLFYSKIKKSEDLAYEPFLKVYKTQYLLRLFILDISALFCLVGFYLFESQNLVLMAIINISATLFCYPSKEALLPPVERAASEDQDHLPDSKEQNSIEIETENNNDHKL